jgi:rubrerythrin
MTSFAAKLKDYIKEEKADSNKYQKLASIAPEKYAPIIRDIAKEEGTHMRHLEMILNECDIEDLDDVNDSEEPIHTSKTLEKKRSSEEE